MFAGGEGISISYGDIPEAALNEGVSIGERGAGRGLRLLLRTYVHNQLVVMWDNVIMHTVAVPDFRTPGDDEFAPLHVRLDNRLLQVWWRDRRIVLGLRCPWFAPQPSWRWAIGARAGQRADDHWVANLTMLSSHYSVDVGAVSLDVSLNDQDYTDQHQFYAFHGSPEVGGISPTSGPADGGTRMTLMGADRGQGLAEGLHYTCRFGNADYPEDVHEGGTSGGQGMSSGDRQGTPSGDPQGLTPGANGWWRTPLEQASGAVGPWGATPRTVDARAGDAEGHFQRLSAMLEAEPRAGAAASDPASRASGAASYSLATRHDPYVSRSPDLAANGEGPPSCTAHVAC